MLFAAEDEELFAQTYVGLLKADEDSSEDEEYVPKDLETTEGDIDDLEGDDASNSDDASTSGSDSSDDDEGDDDDDDEDEEEGGDENENSKGVQDLHEKQTSDHVNQNLTTKLDIKKENVHSKNGPSHNIQPGSPTKAAYDSCRKICSVCLGDQSDEDDEIIECDACGVSVHEACYGVSGEDHAAADNTSVQSNISSESTEPWFCEPCKKSVKSPLCELCPNTGGIFKQTDTGRWIHMVCALYTRGVTFENIENLSEVSLFELNYGLYGSKVSLRPLISKIYLTTCI